MHDHIASNQQHPTQKFHKKLKKFQKPQKFQENLKPRSKCVKCMKKKRLEKHTRGKMQGLDRNPSGEGEGSEGRMLEGEKRNFYRWRNKKVRSNFALNLFKQNAA